MAPIRLWSLTASDPLALRLAADVRLGPTDYTNDHIWELVLAGGDPPALAVRTTYGLRARDMRLFPSFTEDARTVTDPAEFVSPTKVEAFFVNYARVVCEPLLGVAVTADYWVPDSHTLIGQFTLTNTGITARHLSVRLSGRPLGSHVPAASRSDSCTFGIYKGAFISNRALFPAASSRTRTRDLLAWGQLLIGHFGPQFCPAIQN